MKIVLSVDGDEFGGAELSLVNLVEADNGQNKFALVGPDCTAMRKLSERLPFVDCQVVPHAPTRSVSLVRSLRSALRVAKPDIIQVTLCNPAAGVAAQLAGFSLGVPTIAVEQLVRPIDGPKTRHLKTAMSGLLSDHVAVGEQSARATERHFLLSHQSVRAIYNGISTEQPDSPVQSSPGSDSEASEPVVLGDVGTNSVIGFVGRLEHQKGVDRLLAALPFLADTRLLLVGDGSLRSDLERQAKTLGVEDRVQFLGWQSRPRKLLSQFDVFVLPSRNEAFPLTIVEAMLGRVPVVSTDVGSIAEAITHEQTGLLVDADDPRALAAQIRLLLVNAELRTTICDNAERLALSTFTAKAMSQAYDAMWNDLRGRPFTASPIRFLKTWAKGDGQRKGEL